MYMQFTQSSCSFQYKKERIIIIFTYPSARAGYDTRSIFKQSFTVFLLLVASARLKNLVCPTIYP